MLLDYMMMLFMLSFYDFRGSTIFYTILNFAKFEMKKHNAGFIKELSDFITSRYMFFTVTASLFITYYSYSQQSNYRLQTRMINRFKKLMDMSEEGIVFLKEKDIFEYMNDKFIE